VARGGAVVFGAGSEGRPTAKVRCRAHVHRPHLV
jgi:hypothetical protein